MPKHHFFCAFTATFTLSEPRCTPISILIIAEVMYTQCLVAKDPKFGFPGPEACRWKKGAFVGDEIRATVI